MFKIYSKGCEYVLRALTEIPSKEAQGSFLAKDLCKKAKVPEASTRKGFQRLVHCGVLEAVTGPGGGYKLSRAPKDISLYLIVIGIDGEEVFDQCIMGLPHCKDNKPCPIHYSWKKLKMAVIRELKKKKLADLMSSIKNAKGNKG